ncbi:MAG: response regulator transcription factor [Acidobacteriota bacterium]
MIRVAIADDHTLLREGIKGLLELETSMAVVGEAQETRQVLDLVKATSPDVLLLDVTMPGRDSLETVQELKSRFPQVGIVMLTAHPEDHYAIRCLRAGADGYVTKTRATETLLDAIRKVHSGGKFISSTLAEQMAISLQTDFETAPHEHLSDREFQVLKLLASGLTVTEIAESLFLSVKTVSTYRTRVLQKMNLSNNAQLTRYCLKEGLIS